MTGCDKNPTHFLRSYLDAEARQPKETWRFIYHAREIRGYVWEIAGISLNNMNEYVNPLYDISDNMFKDMLSFKNFYFT